jgi:hypothetical protein
MDSCCKGFLLEIPPVWHINQRDSCLQQLNSHI